jgi:hypothetical protein
MDEPTNTVSGKALYRELVNGEQTAQVIVIPEGVTSKGSKNATTLLRRTVSKWSPRKTWQQDAAHTYKPELASALIADGTTAKFVEVADEGDAELMALEALTSTQSLLTYLIARDWKLRETPLVLEVSVADIDDLAAQCRATCCTLWAWCWGKHPLTGWQRSSGSACCCRGAVRRRATGVACQGTL